MDKLAIFNKEHVMFDLETLSRTPGGVIVQIGACRFTFENGITDRFLVNIDVESSLKLGLTISQSTIDWWATQPKEARNSWRKNPVDVREAHEQFIKWSGNAKNVRLWSLGAFDKGFLAYSMNKLNLESPYKYWNEMDSRTVYGLFGINNKTLRESSTEGVYHNALDDSIAQATHLISLFT